MSSAARRDNRCKWLWYPPCQWPGLLRRRVHQVSGEAITKGVTVGEHSKCDGLGCWCHHNAILVDEANLVSACCQSLVVVNGWRGESQCRAVGGGIMVTLIVHLI